jgi:hypothetical protein
MPGSRTLIVLGAAAAAVVLFLVLRPAADGDAPEPPEATPTATATETTDTESGGTDAETETETRTETEPETETRTAPRAEVVTIRVLVRGGVPDGGIRRVTVPRGRQVRLVVRADVADHVHLHGYDIMRDVAPGAPAQILFRATTPGRFEAELEDRGLQIAEIEVRP